MTGNDHKETGTSGEHKNSRDINGNAQSKKMILTVAVSGVFAALILVATAVTAFTTPIGYYNMGDGVILTCAYLFGPLAVFPAAIGSALSDLILGYSIYIPATFVIKGLMGFLAGWIMRRDEVKIPVRIGAFVLAEVLMVMGYFAYESLPFMYGPAAASAQLLANTIQGSVGIVVALLFSGLLGSLRVRARKVLF